MGADSDGRGGRMRPKCGVFNGVQSKKQMRSFWVPEVSLRGCQRGAPG